MLSKSAESAKSAVHSRGPKNAPWLSYTKTAAVLLAALVASGSAAAEEKWWENPDIWSDSSKAQTELLYKGIREFSYFKDGSRAILRHTRVRPISDGALWWCAEVNAPNSYGGMAGWTYLFAQHNPANGEWTFNTGDYRTQAELRQAARTGGGPGPSDVMVVVGCEQAW